MFNLSNAIIFSETYMILLWSVKISWYDQTVAVKCQIWKLPLLLKTTLSSPFPEIPISRNSVFIGNASSPP
jgi:hypothetical protein